MILIAGHTHTERERRDAAVEAFAAMVGRARRQEGCLDMSISADTVDPERINVFECWRDQEALEAWRKVARAPRVALKDASVKLYRSGEAEEPFSRRPRRGAK